MPGAAVPRFDSVTIDYPDPAALARFYGELLEWPVPAPAGDAEYVAIDPPSGGTAINFQRAPGFAAPAWPDPAVQQQAPGGVRGQDEPDHRAMLGPWCRSDQWC